MPDKLKTAPEKSGTLSNLPDRHIDGNPARNESGTQPVITFFVPLCCRGGARVGTACTWRTGRRISIGAAFSAWLTQT